MCKVQASSRGKTQPTLHSRRFGNMPIIWHPKSSFTINQPARYTKQQTPLQHQDNCCSTHVSKQVQQSIPSHNTRTAEPLCAPLQVHRGLAAPLRCSRIAPLRRFAATAGARVTALPDSASQRFAAHSESSERHAVTLPSACLYGTVSLAGRPQLRSQNTSPVKSILTRSRDPWSRNVAFYESSMVGDCGIREATPCAYVTLIEYCHSRRQNDHGFPNYRSRLPYFRVCRS